MKQTRFICLILFLGVSNGKCEDNICPKSDIPANCCSGYRIINNTCTGCVGFYGINCSIPCPVGHYGVKCELRCNCTEKEECNPYVGCLHIMYIHGGQPNWCNIWLSFSTRQGNFRAWDGEITTSSLEYVKQSVTEIDQNCFMATLDRSPAQARIQPRGIAHSHTSTQTELMSALITELMSLRKTN
ncbi:multiple epidermal growth factor-like domains protein 11 [Saccostrea cucullata]|uniref:multiple epidermal growth factor-like domains protein 11 n=1 Tax=Saccostrea cuccullata TaxID=36930 RepID=UPI002ED3A2B9